MKKSNSERTRVQLASAFVLGIIGIGVLAGAAPLQNNLQDKSARGKSADGKSRRPWETKKFSAWTIEDARAIITDSPWAKQKPLPAAGRPAMTVVEPGAGGAGNPTAAIGNAANAATGPAMSNGGSSTAASTSDPVHDTSGTTPSGLNNPIGAPVVRSPVTVFWASATPVRLAILKLRSNGAALDSQETAKATARRESYIVAISGLPIPEGGTDARSLAQNASLRVKGKPLVRANESSYRRIGDSDVFFFRFSRSSLPISSADGEVEFQMKLGAMEVSQTFKLNQMLFDGRLAL